MDFVLVEHGLGGARTFFQGANFSQSLQASVARPGAEHNRLGRTESGAAFDLDAIPIVNAATP